MGSPLFDVLLALQLFHLLFLVLHDWVPLGRLEAVRAADPVDKRVRITLIGAVPVALGFAASLAWVGRTYPMWLLDALAIMYAALLFGELRAWWIPYLVRPEPLRAARYQAVFGRTHTLFPARNGIRPNTLHVILHAATLATVILLAVAIIARM